MRRVDNHDYITREGIDNNRLEEMLSLFPRFQLSVVQETVQKGRSDIHIGYLQSVEKTTLKHPLYTNISRGAKVKVVAKSYNLHSSSIYKRFMNSLAVYLDKNIGEDIKGKFYGVFTSAKSASNYTMYLIFEYFSYGTLRGIINGGKILERSHYEHYCTELVRLFSQFHRYYYHGDVKPLNICIANDDDPKGGGREEWNVETTYTKKYHLRLIDFDSCTKVDSEISKLSGTIQYMSPEMLNAFRNDTELVNRTSSDVWSIGIIMYTMSERRYPWKFTMDDKDVQNYAKMKENYLTLYNIIAQYLPSITFTKFTESPLIKVVLCCLHFTRTARPTMESVSNLLRALGIY